MLKKYIYIIRTITLIVLIVSLLFNVFIQPVAATSLVVRPTAAGSLTNITSQSPGAGSHWDKVDEVVADETTTYVYLSSGIGGGDQTDLYTTANHTTEVGLITSVVITTRGQKSDVDGDCKIATALRTHSTTYYGTLTQMTLNTWIDFSTTYNTNPNTLTAWTWTEIDDMEIGVRLTSTAGDARCTQVYATITYAANPTVTTTTASLTANSTHCFVAMNGEITDNGFDIFERGFAYGTTCNSTMPTSAQVPPAGYTSNWSEWNADFGSGTYSYTTNLTCCSSYCYRAYTRSSVGYTWGDEISFTMICEPDITTVTATYISATTTRLNAVVVSDGGQAADVRFFYSTVSGNCTDLAICDTGTCNATSYNGTTPWVENTYTTGMTPYVDITGLVPNKTYYFCSQIRNDHNCRCGGELSFTTSTGVNVPTNLSGIPTGTTISLLWIKGSGSTNTLIKYKTGTYPTGTGDGITAYFNTKNSVIVSGLTPGLSYFFMAWGESGGFYSTANVTLHLTTLAYTTAADTMPGPTTPTTWYQSPDYTKMSALPWYGMVNFWADSFEIPKSTLWFINSMLVVLGLGILTYIYGGQKILLSDIVCLLGVGLTAAMGLCSLWIILPFIIILLSALAVGERI